MSIASTSDAIRINLLPVHCGLTQLSFRAARAAMIFSARRPEVKRQGPV